MTSRASRPLRVGGFAPIADYGLLGDGRSVALVASDGCVDWWAAPALDTPPLCAAVLDPATGGHFSLHPVGQGAAQAQRRYLPRTNVLETTWTTEQGTVRVTESLSTGSSGPLPWTELARRIEGVEGEVELSWELAPGSGMEMSRSWTTLHQGMPVVVVGSRQVGVVTHGAGTVTTGRHGISGQVRTAPGSRSLVAAVATCGEPLFLPDPTTVDQRIDRTASMWRQWCAGAARTGRWNGAVQRSALALRTLLHQPTGAIAAAATTSLPERVGGDKNWDYRFAWVRDSSFTVDALLRLGLDEEVHAAVSWLLSAIRRTAPDLHVLYTLSGEVAGEEHQPDVPGYQNSTPVRLGNGAAGQSQLGTFGDLFDTIARYVRAGHFVDRDTGRLLADLADRCCDRWMTQDSGIWELPALEHYTISKMGCWVALRRAVELADAGQIPNRRSDRWQVEAREIRAFVERECWSAEKQAYTLRAGSNDLDAAVLLAGRTGYDRGHRLASTIDAVVDELGDGPWLYRYSGMQAEEGAFIACSFWLVEALVHTGQAARATALMDQAVAGSSRLGLLAEQIDPATGAHLGNMPQGLSHLALVNAAWTCDGA